MVAPGAAAWRRLHLRGRSAGPRDELHRRPVLVIAPHPDDESLGVGAWLAQRAMAGVRDGIAFLTDGSGSHRGAAGWSPARVARARAGEGRRALLTLGLVEDPILLGWADAAPEPAEAAAFQASVARLVAYVRRRQIGAVVATWAGEPHCDHEAAARLADAVARRCGIGRLDYLVWGWTLDAVETQVAGRRIVAIDVRRGRERQRRAIMCHRSQFGGRIFGGTRFRLPRAMRDLADRPGLILLGERHRHAA